MNQQTRRQFFKTAAATAGVVAVGVAPRVVRGEESRGMSDMTRLYYGVPITPESYVDCHYLNGCWRFYIAYPCRHGWYRCTDAKDYQGGDPGGMIGGQQEFLHYDKPGIGKTYCDSVEAKFLGSLL